MPVGTTQGLITRCPDCSTAFRASAGQLAARDGQVRCGRCGRVFDAVENAVPAVQSKPATSSALENNTEDTADGPAESIAPAPDFLAAQPAPAESPSEADNMPVAPDPEHLVEAGDGPGYNEPPIPAELQVENTDSMEAAADGSDTAQPEAVTAAETAAVADFTENEPLPASTPAPFESDITVFEPPPYRASGKSTTTATAEPLQWEFGRPKPATRRVPRWVGIPGVMLLSVVMLGQIAHHLRSDLVLLFPSIRPAAEQVCEWTGCELPSPQRAELMSIESSDLQADSTNPAVMVLSATLRNRAPFPQAPPALELTLTDAQDQPTARRVLSAEDYSVRGVQNNLFPASSELPIKVYFEASAVKATGYRLYLFYP